MENTPREQRQQRHHQSKKRQSTPADVPLTCESSQYRRSRAPATRSSSSSTRRLAAASNNSPSTCTKDRQRRSFALVMQQIPSFRGLAESEDDCEREDNIIMEASHNGRSTSTPSVQRPSLHRRSTVDEYVSKSSRAQKSHKASSGESVSSRSVSNHNKNTRSRSNSKGRSNSRNRRKSHGKNHSCGAEAQPTTSGGSSRRHARTTGQPRSLQKEQRQRLREVIGSVNRQLDLDEDDTIADWESSSVIHTDAVPTGNHHHHNNGSRRHSRTTGHRSSLQKKQQKQLQQVLRNVDRELSNTDFFGNTDGDVAQEPVYHGGCNNSSRRHSRTTGRSTLQKKQQQQLQQVIRDINRDTIDDIDDEMNPWESMIDTGIPATKVTLHRVSDVDDDVLFHADFSSCSKGNTRHNGKAFQHGPSAHTRSTHTQSTRTSFSTEGSQETEDPFLFPGEANTMSCTALDFDSQDADSTDFFSQLASASATKNMNASQAFVQGPTELSPPVASPKSSSKVSVATKYSNLAGRVALKSPIAGASRRRQTKGQPLAAQDGFRSSSSKKAGEISAPPLFVADEIMMLPLHQEAMNESTFKSSTVAAKDKSKSYHIRTSVASPDATSSPRPRRRNSLGNQQDVEEQQDTTKVVKDQLQQPHMWSLSNLVAMTMPHGKLGRQNQQRQKSLQPRQLKPVEREELQETMRHNFFGEDVVVVQQ